MSLRTRSTQKVEDAFKPCLLSTFGQEARRGQDWTWTIWRPPVIFGHALGAPMNVLAATGAYAALEREQGRGLAFPGGACGVTDGVDTRLLARAFDWAFDNPASRNQIFNLTNGGLYVWPNVWPSIAEAMDMPLAANHPTSLAQSLPQHEKQWASLAKKHDLAEASLVRLLGDSAIYADMLLGYGNDRPIPPSLLSDVKIRQAGFAECLDTEKMLIDWIQELRRMRVLP